MAIRPRVEVLADVITTHNKTMAYNAESVLSSVSVREDGAVVAPHVINNVSALAAKNIDLIKGQILPLIKEVAEMINKEISNRGLEGPLESKSVTYFSIPPMLDELIRRGYVDSKREYGDTAFIPYGMMFTMTGEEVAELIGFGTGGLNKLSVDIFRDKENIISMKEDIIDIWDTYLKTVIDTDGKFSRLFVGYNTTDELIILLKMYSILSAILEKGYKGTVGYKGDVKAGLRGFINKISATLTNYLKLFEDAKHVVAVRKNGNVSVFKDRFVKLVENKNNTDENVTIEGILGSSIELSGLLTEYMLVKDNDKFADDWKNHLVVENLKRKNNNIELYIALYKHHILGAYEDLAGDIVKHKVDASVREQEVVEYFNNLDTSDLYDVIKNVEQGFCILFKHTNVRQFLDRYNNYIKTDENITSELAVVLTTLEFITDHLLLGIDVK